MEPLHPLFLKLAGRRVVVIGAGEAGARKIAELADAGADVLVVAERVVDRVTALADAGRVKLETRAYAPKDLEGAWLVVAATDAADVQRAISESCEKMRVFCIALDDPRAENGSAYSASVIRRAPFTIAISSSGEAPALSRLLREVLEDALPDATWVDAARALREKWKREKTPMNARFGELLRAFTERANRR